MKLKTWAVAVLIIQALSLPALAGESLQDRLSDWSASPQYASHSKAGGSGEVRGRLFLRYVHLNETSFPVANIVAFDFPKARIDIPKFVETARQGMGFEAWHVRRQKNAQVYEAIWAPVHQFVRLYLVERGDRVHVSLAMVRVLYGDNVLTETELLQRELAGVGRGRARWVDRITTIASQWTDWVGLLGAPAWAGGCPPCDPSNPVSFFTCASCTADNAASGANANANALASGANAISAGAGTIGGKIDNLTGSVDRMSNSTDRAAQTMQNISNQWHPTAERAVDEAHQFNENFAKALDPLTGFTMAASAALGVFTVGMATNGAIEGAKALWELISHAGEDELTLEQFKTAREEVEKLEPMIAQLEGRLNGDYGTALEAKAAGSRQALLQRMSEANRKDRILSQAIAKIQEAGTLQGIKADDACMTRLNQEGARLENLLADSEAVVKRLQGTNQDALCAEMKADVSKAINTEKLLRRARIKLLKGRHLAENDWSKDFEKEEADLKYIVEHLPDVRDASIARMEAKRKVVLDTWWNNYHKLVDLPENQEAIQRCLKRKGYYESDNPDVRMPSPPIWVTTQCQNQAVLTPANEGIYHFNHDREEIDQMSADINKEATKRYQEQNAKKNELHADPKSDEVAHGNLDRSLDKAFTKVRRPDASNSVAELEAKQKAIEENLCKESWEDPHFWEHPILSTSLLAQEAQRVGQLPPLPAPGGATAPSAPSAAPAADGAQTAPGTAAALPTLPALPAPDSQPAAPKPKAPRKDIRSYSF